MLWYVIQTYTGREEKLVEMIRRIVPGEYYGECFVCYYEQIRCRKQENQVHILRLFPGYVFISTADVDRLFQRLKSVPAMSKIMAAGAFAFFPLDEGEAEFIMDIMDEHHVARLTYVATDGRDHVAGLSGPLEKCVSRIREYQFRKRYALVCLRIAGQEKTVRMGIILNDDIRRELAYGKVEAMIHTPDRYEIPDSGQDRGPESVPVQLRPGDTVTVTGGVFEGNRAVVSRAGKDTVKIAVSILGRELYVELPAEDVTRTAEDDGTAAGCDLLR